MAQPFTCPNCGAHDYVIVLSGCNITNATVEEGLSWNEETEEYESTGSIVSEAENVEHQDAHAVCSGCEQDVSEAVSAYENAQEQPAGDGLVQLDG
jgi:predicted aldo/keto reductase-like oxidoreductase